MHLERQRYFNVSSKKQTNAAQILYYNGMQVDNLIRII